MNFPLSKMLYARLWEHWFYYIFCRKFWVSVIKIHSKKNTAMPSSSFHYAVFITLYKSAFNKVLIKGNFWNVWSSTFV